MEFGVGLGRNERMSKIADLSRVAEENGFSHASFVDTSTPTGPTPW